MALPELPEGLPAAEDLAHMAAFRLPAERGKRHLARLLLTVLLHRAVLSGLPARPSVCWHPLPQLFHHAAQAVTLPGRRGKAGGELPGSEGRRGR